MPCCTISCWDNSTKRPIYRSSFTTTASGTAGWRGSFGAGVRRRPRTAGTSGTLCYGGRGGAPARGGGGGHGQPVLPVRFVTAGGGARRRGGGAQSGGGARGEGTRAGSAGGG